METNNNQFSRLGQWLNSSLSIKLIVIFFMTLVSMIPISLLGDLVREREGRQLEVVQEVSQSWSGPQVIGGPVLILPYTKMVRVTAAGLEQLEERTQYIYLLPEKLSITASTDNELLKRGIYPVSVYESSLRLQGHFGAVNLEKEQVRPEQIHWQQVRMLTGVGDLRGVKTVSPVLLGADSYGLDEYARDRVFANNLIVSPRLGDSVWDRLPFDFSLELKGTGSLGFLQLARETQVSVSGNWSSPKFVGQFLPDSRDVQASGFEAGWALSYFARNLPQQWAGEQLLLMGKPQYTGGVVDPFQQVTEAKKNGISAAMEEVDAFGIEFIQPVNHYQKTDRAVKYAILIIVLTFLSLFFTEVITRRRVHIMQYILIGGAMVVFYTLLLALSEHLGFDPAYGIAALATIGLVSGFIGTILRQRRIALFFAGILGVFYVFIYTVIQLQDMALLVGSIGLFLTVATLMYFSGRINWSQEAGQE